MTTRQQLRRLLDGYVIDRNTGAALKPRRGASIGEMTRMAKEHGITVILPDGRDGCVMIDDDTYTYVLDEQGEPAVVAG